MKLFERIEPKTNPVPIVISVPHAGTKFPNELKSHYKKRMRHHLDDTDWFVHRLYDFAPDLGITLIKANLSRWVIDLNRDPKSVPLYQDGRLITGLTPTTDFFGNKIYGSEEVEPDQKEIDRRLANYFWPYYHEIESILKERKSQFGKVLLWDAHSIRHLVSTIQPTPFPDMILGNNEEQTAHPSIIEAALSGLKNGNFQINHNDPFKGGHITRYFGKPETGVYGLQLEMNKILYMDDSEVTYNEKRAAVVKDLLFNTFKNMTEAMQIL